MSEFIGVYVLGFASENVDAKDLIEKAEAYREGSRDFDYIVLRLEDIAFLKHIHEAKIWKIGVGNSATTPDLSVYGILRWGFTPPSVQSCVSHLVK